MLHGYDLQLLVLVHIVAGHQVPVTALSHHFVLVTGQSLFDFLKSLAGLVSNGLKVYEFNGHFSLFSIVHCLINAAEASLS